MSETRPNVAFDFGGDIVWRPSSELRENCRLKVFMNRHGIASFEELMERSTSDVEWFWQAVLEELDVRFYQPYRQILDTSRGVPWSRWCVGGKLNIVHNCLDKRVGTPDEERTALVWEGEEGLTRSLTYGELARDVSRAAAGLRALGVGKGDVVALFMPMTPEVAVAFLAIVKIGAIVLPLFSGYGSQAVATRLADSEAKLLFTADGVYRRGKTVALKPIADEALARAPSVDHVVVQRRVAIDVPMKPDRDREWGEFLLDGPESFPTEPTDAEDPLMLIYTSGTTGRPKGAVHTHCGFPVKAAQDMVHGFDLRQEDRLFWMSDMGWMMGPWEVLGTTLLGATMFLFDGAPDYPGPGRIWEMVEKHGISHLGVSPTLIRALQRHGESPLEGRDLTSLRMFGSTGEPWNPDAWLWLFEKVGRSRIPIINYSGGTEISGGILMGNLLRPLKPCAFSGPVPGMAADVVDDKGNSVRGAVGELVIRKPWIGMSRGFWRDPERYLESYWSRFPDVWVHGDWAAVDQDDLWYVLGRSDDTMNLAGKRLGPAEVEAFLGSHPAVAESAAVGIPDELKGEALICFCVLRPEHQGTDVLREELAQKVAQGLGKALRPKAVCFVSDLPKTRNAKIMRRVIRSAYLGQDPGDLTALENPQAVEAIRSAQ
jgi:acetyl-CoA synthetase